MTRIAPIALAPVEAADDLEMVLHPELEPPCIANGTGCIPEVGVCRSVVKDGGLVEAPKVRLIEYVEQVCRHTEPGPRKLREILAKPQVDRYRGSSLIGCLSLKLVVMVGKLKRSPP